MKRDTVVVAIFSVLAAVATGMWTSSTQVASAQSQLTIPKAYGSLRGATPDFMFLEDNTGTIRVLDRAGNVIRTFTRN